MPDRSGVVAEIVKTEMRYIIPIQYPLKHNSDRMRIQWGNVSDFRNTIHDKLRCGDVPVGGFRLGGFQVPLFILTKDKGMMNMDGSTVDITQRQTADLPATHQTEGCK